MGLRGKDSPCCDFVTKPSQEVGRSRIQMLTLSDFGKS